MDAIVIFTRCVYLLLGAVLLVEASNLYTAYNIEDDRTCSLGRPSRILMPTSNIAIIVQENNYFKPGSFSGKHPYYCKFSVDASSGFKLFAVIQKMTFRKEEKSGQCIDYVQFRSSNPLQISGSIPRTSEHSWSPKICGNIDISRPDLTTIIPIDSTRPLPFTFVDLEGKIDVQIYVANVTIPPIGNLDLKIAFTAYRPCSDHAPSYKKCNADKCIWSEFFDDNVLNCPFSDYADILDLKEAGISGFKNSSGLATKIMVGAVAGLLTMFVVFIAFLWLYRHCVQCWNGAAPSAQNTTQMRPVPTAEEIQPTAPPLTLSSSADKDLPPSYESLFPNA